MEGNYLNIAVQFKSLLTDLYGNRLSKLILFGSYARVEAREDSDIDFLVVLKDKEISVFKEIEKINGRVYQIILENGKLISFLPVAENNYENVPNYFYTLVKQEGKTI